MMQESFANKEWFEVTDAYSQYFHASCEYNGSFRRAALVKLSVLKDSEGVLAYRISATFIPFEDEEDFRVPEDVRIDDIVSFGKKRRGKKEEEKLLEQLPEEIDSRLSKWNNEAVIFWDRPLREARFG